MRFSTICYLAAVILVASCNKKTAEVAETPTEVEASTTADKTIAFGEQEFLKIGETCGVAEGEGTVTFVKILEDSRCPIGVDCFQEGQAVIMVKVDGENRRLELSADARARTRIPISGGTLEILKLEPYPKANVRIDPAQRGIRIRLLKGSSGTTNPNKRF